MTRTQAALASDLDPRIELLVLGRRGRFDPIAALTLVRFARRRQVDVLHVHMRSSLAFVLALRMVGLLRLPIAFHDHYGSIEIDDAVPAWFRLGHRAIGHYVGVSAHLEAWARRAGVPAHKTSMIMNGVDLRRLTSSARTGLRRELGLDPQRLLAVLVASFKREKGIELMIEAVARCERRSALQVVVIGAGIETSYAAECRAALAAHGLTGQIVFAGIRTDVPAILHGADLGLLASHSESGPLVLLEYLAAGLPIVATCTGEIGGRLASLGVPGLVPPREPIRFAEALDTVLALSPDARHARGELGRAVLTETWDIRASLPRWYEVYAAAQRG